MFWAKSSKEIAVVFIVLTIIKLTNAAGLDFCVPKSHGLNQNNRAEVQLIIENFKPNLEEGIDKISEPSAPIDSFHFNFSHPALSLAGDLYNFTMDLEKYDLKILQLKSYGFELFNVTIPSIRLKGSNYSWDGHVGQGKGLFKVFGSNGPFAINLTSFSVAFRISVSSNSSGLCIPVELVVNIQKAEYKLTHFMGDDPTLEPLFTKLFASVTKDAIPIFWDEWGNGYLEPIQKKINDFFHWDSTNISFVKLVNWIHENQDKLLSRKIKI